MIVIETTSNGRTLITIKRDWWAGSPRADKYKDVPKVRSMEPHEVKWQKVLCKPPLA